jgi:ribosomal protein S18 acetylase RimI-like enzyme
MARTDLNDLNPNNLNQLRRLNAVLFPFPYNDTYYADALQSGPWTKFALFNDMIVGAVLCKQTNDAVYILTLGVLAPYRRRGLGRLMLQYITDLCKQDSSITRIQLHVQTNNDVARQFYENVGGFSVKETIPDYYKGQAVTSAWLLQLDL